VEANTKQSAVAEIYYAERQKKHIERVFKKPVKILFVKEGEKGNGNKL
jgi:exopolyphosphatase / guanosine-5'-triphosphate,3'-diphosphate pyrophosphatase